ncbi:MAG: site-specific integrase [Clostridia bacterium]|nr:site-specific integrase [Clostridia bacterium]
MPIYKADGKKNGLQKYRVKVNYTDPNTGKAKQIERTAYGLEEAKETERRLSHEVKEVKESNITVQQLYDEYLAVQKNALRESTLDKTKRTLELYVIPQFSALTLKKLTLQTLQKWKLDIEETKTTKDTPLSLEYKRKIFSVFRTFLNYAVKMEYISTNPLVKLGNFKDANSFKSDMDYYTSEEFIKFISTARKCAEDAESSSGNISEWNYYVFFNIAFYAGMRKGEIHALKWTDIKDNTIHITRSVAQKLKGEDRETPPKNKSSIRSIQIPIPLKKVLDEHYARCKLLDGFSDSWRICGGESCLRDSTLDKRNEKYAELAGIKKIRMHDYRHSHASLLANNGINIQEIARRLGHSSVEMTWNVYSHLYPKEEERALEILNNVIFRG